MRISNRELMIALGVLLLSVSLSQAAEAEQTEEGIGGRQVMVMGDSLAEGLWAGLRKWHTQTHAAAKTGTTARYWRSRALESFERARNAGRIDVVFIVLGTNDWKPPIADYQAAWTAFHAAVAEIDAAARTVAPVVVWVVPRWVAWADDVERNLRQAGVLLVNPPREQPAIDGIHLSAAGYESWSKSVVKEAERWLKR